MSRDIGIACLLGAFLMFVFGVVIGTSQFAGQAVAWGLCALLLLVAAIAGARAVLLEQFPPKE